MAGFPLGGGGGGARHGRDDHHHHHRPPPPVNPDAAAFLYPSTASRGGFQLWQQQPAHPFYAPNIIRFADDPAAAGSGDGSSSRGGRMPGAGPGAGTISCQDCGNQAKKDCTHLRCRTCCKSRGFDCATHVKSTWVPAAKRRERQSLLAAADSSKRPRDSVAAASTPTTSSGEQQQMMVGERFPREVSSEAVFRCVRLGPVDEADAEVAYQTTVSIAGHVFKGILHDVGPEPSSGGGGGIGRHAAAGGEGSSPSTAAAPGGGVGGEGSSSVAAAVSSSAVVMDPYPTPGPFGGGAPFFHGHPRSLNLGMS